MFNSSNSVNVHFALKERYIANELQFRLKLLNIQTFCKMKTKNVFCVLLLLYSVNRSYGLISDCTYIDNKKDSVQLSCNSSVDSVEELETRENGCFFDLFKSPTNSSNRAAVKLLRIHDNNCDSKSQRRVVAEMFSNIQEFEYSFAKIQIILENMAFKRLHKLNMSNNNLFYMGYGYLDSIKDLRELDVSHNKITAIYQSTFDSTLR